MLAVGRFSPGRYSVSYLQEQIRPENIDKKEFTHQSATMPETNKVMRFNQRPLQDNL